MIVCKYAQGIVAWQQGPKLTYIPDPRLTDTEGAAEEARLKLAFSRPADVPTSIAVEPAGIADGFRSEAPGSADHALGVMRTLDGVTFLIDDGG